MATTSSTKTVTSLPGFGKPVNWAPEKQSTRYREQFENALDGSYYANLTAARELKMIQFLNTVTDKPEWQTKVWDEEITTKWRSEVPEGVMTTKMMDWCIEELKFKSKSFAETGISPAIDHGVFKSDSLISSSMREALIKAVAPLENIPERLKDYHPGSDGKVLDLVHPSLYPLIYGRSRILKDEEIDLSNCLKACGKGELVPVPLVQQFEAGYVHYRWKNFAARWSSDYQWLPCEVKFDEDSTSRVKITSYINNLHPHGNEPLYATIESIISLALPLWNLSLTALKNHGDLPVNRIEVPRDFKFLDEDGNELDDYDYDNQDGRTFVAPDAIEFDDSRLPAFLGGLHPDKAEEKIDLATKYKDSGLQIIVKLANIQLTPDKPAYDGGSWHVEGKSNEHVCATAIYYYDCENVTESSLAFRAMVSDEFDIGYAQDDAEGPEQYFGLVRDEAAVQDIGSVVTKDGRLISFPNAFQHRVAPFRLADPTRPGHRKILALFLVDPSIRIISTAHIPPQQASWWAGEISKGVPRLEGLPAETLQQIVDSVEDFPIQIEEAKGIRERLMEERKVFVDEHHTAFMAEGFSLCEH